MALSGRVLIIDDESGLRQTFTRILRQAGCEVTSAASGPEALQRLAANTYDIAYLDLRLPEMDGLQVLREISRLYAEMPVVLITGHATLQSAVEALRLGVVDYLMKPIDPAALIARTRTILADHAIQRRRREIQAQIEALQAELRSLQPTQPDPLHQEWLSTPGAVVPSSANRFLKRGDLILDLQARRATFGERVLSLPPAAFDYLVVLARHSPDVVEYQTLVAEAQGYQTDRRQAQELAKWHIHELRDALEPDSRHPRYILNVRGLGYNLLVD